MLTGQGNIPCFKSALEIFAGPSGLEIPLLTVVILGIEWIAAHFPVKLQMWDTLINCLHLTGQIAGGKHWDSCNAHATVHAVESL